MLSENILFFAFNNKKQKIIKLFFFFREQKPVLENNFQTGTRSLVKFMKYF